MTNRLPPDEPGQPDDEGTSPDRGDVATAIADFTVQGCRGRMDHAGSVGSHMPIGGGVTEAACEVLVKRRPRGPGMV